MKHFSILIIVVSSLLVACDMFSSNGFDEQEFEAYLKLKRIPLNDEKRYERIKQEYLKKSALVDSIEKAETLDQTQIDVEVEEFRKQLMVSRYFEAYLEEAVSDQGIKNYYSQNIENYKTRRVHVAHILFRVNPKMGEPERQKLLTAAGEAYSKINSGADFAEVARAQSEDKVSAAKGGDLGWINEGAVSKEFSAKAFSMKAGEVSEPLLTAFGYHLLKVIEEPQEVTKPLESVKGDIRYQLRSKSKQVETQRLLESNGYSE